MHADLKVAPKSETSQRACVPVEEDELASLELVSKIFRREVEEVEQESLEVALPFAYGLDVVGLSDARTFGLVQGNVGQP